MTDSRRKGVRRERDVVNAYKALDGWDASRASAMLEAAGGVTGVDVRAWGDDLKLAIQVRSQKRPNVWDAIADATAGALPGELPIAHVRRTNGAWPEPSTNIVVIGEQDWLALLTLLSGSVAALAPSSQRKGSQAAPTFLTGGTSS